MKAWIIGVAALLVVLIAAIVGAAVWWTGGGPPAIEEISDQDAAVEALKNADFSKLSEEEKVAYADKLRELRPWDIVRRRSDTDETTGEGTEDQLQLTDEERQRIRQNARELFHAAMKDRVQGYFELPAEDRIAYLDRMIDDMQERRRQMEEPRSGPGEGEPTPPGQDGKDRDRSPPDDADRRKRGMARLKERIETTDPEERAQFVEFMKQMRQRMEERGIEPPRFGRPPR